MAAMRTRRHRFRAGALADLVAISLDGVRLAGSVAADLIQAVVFAGGAADVTDVVVGGQFVVRGGFHTSVDVPRELSNAIARVTP